MLNRVAWQTSTRTDVPHVAPREEPIIDLREVFRALRRRQAWIVGSVALAICSAVIYLTITPPYYAASSMLLFESRKIEPFQQQAQNAAGDSAFVDSQVEVLKSENIAKSVVRDLDLVSDPEFVPPKGGLLASVFDFTLGLFKPGLGAGKASLGTDKEGKAASAQADPFGRVVRRFRRNLTIKRIGLTYLIAVEYQSLDPNKAAWISNAVAEAYLLAEQNSKQQAARRANVWLEERITELRNLAQSTERAVADYKAKNAVVNTGPAQLNEQQLAELSTQRRLVLQDLESSARTYRALHETLLQRIGEFTQQQSFPAAEARVVSQASPPLEKSGPKTLLTLGIASVLGLLGGLGAAFGREYFDGTFRSSKQVEKELGIDCLGTLPMIAASRRWFPKWQDPANEDRVISPSTGLHRFVAREPFSRFAETIRSLKVAADAADLHRPNGVKVIGVTSARHHEGKSLVAANLSEMIAMTGCKVLLIDCGPHSGGLTEQFAPQAQSGLMDVIANQSAVKDFVWRDPSTDLHFLPAVKTATERDPITKEKLSPAALLQRTHLSPMALKTLLQSVQDNYDYVILDLRSMSPTADVKAISHLVDAFFLVIEFGRTSQQAVIDALNAAPPVLEKLLGAVLNKADPTELKRSES